MNWNDITLRQLKALQELENNTEMTADEKSVERLNIIYDEDCTLLPIPQYMQRIKESKFLGEPIPQTKLKKKYVINGREYSIFTDLFLLSMGQYIDYTNTPKTEPEKVFAIFFIPCGHKYNDGYDMAQVWEDMLSLPATDVAAMNRFFFRLVKRYQHIFRFCFRRLIKKTTMSPRTAEQVRRLMDLFCGFSRS